MNQEIASLKLQKPHLVSVQPTSSISTVLDVLKKHNIISIPIHSHQKGEGSFMGIISVFDICCYVLRTNHFDHHIESALSLNSDAESFILREVAYLDTLATVMKHLTQVHRLLVVDKKTQFLISQTDVVKYLYESVAKDELTSKSVGEVLPIQKIISLSETITAKQGLEELKSSSHLALPIVNEKGEFVHVLSSADLRGINQESFKTLDLNVIDYLKSIKKQKPATATLNTTIKQVMKCSVENQAHRTFVLEHGKVVNVVSLSDLIKLYLQ